MPSASPGSSAVLETVAALRGRLPYRSSAPAAGKVAPESVTALLREGEVSSENSPVKVSTALL